MALIITIQIDAHVKATMHHGAWFHTPGEFSPLLDTLTIPPGNCIINYEWQRLSFTTSCQNSGANIAGQWTCGMVWG